MIETALIILIYIAIPLWFVAGFGDWWCHRKSDIAHTSGAKETIIHFLMFAEGGVALLMGLFLEINAGVISAFLLLAVLHQFTGIWDLDYAYPRREIRTVEQHMHSFLEVIPYLIIALVCVVHWEQTRALFMHDSKAAFSLEWKHQPLPVAYIGCVLIVALLLFAAYGEELYRCLRARKFIDLQS